MKLEQLAEGVYAFELYSPRQCARLLKKIEAFPGESPNTMNRYGRALVGAEARAWVAKLVEKYVAPITRKYYADLPPLKKHPFAFAVAYSPTTQRSLARHYDEGSAVTLNVCLSPTFEGGGLVFYSAAGERQYVVEQRLGRAIIHRGAQGHRALPVKSGSRTNLILWCGTKKS